MTLNTKTLEDLLRTASVAIKPATTRKVSDSAEEYRYLNNPGSYVGKWRNSFAPYLTEIMDMCGSMVHDAVIFAGPARCGKSDIFFNYYTHLQKTDPSDFLLVHMTKNTARDWSLGDLRKVFRTTTALGEMVMPGRQNLNVHDVHFIGDTRLLVKWPTIAELSGKTIPRHWLMDYDRMTQDVEGEGPPFPLTKKRGDTFSLSYRMTVAESSPGFEVEQKEDGEDWEAESPHEAPPTQGILSLYNDGDRRRWYWRCAKCDVPFEGDFEHLVWNKSIPDAFLASKTVKLKCPHCDFLHTHDANPKDGQPGKAGLNRRGIWLREGEVWEEDGSISGDGRVSTTASFWLKGVAAAFANWQSILHKYLSAKESQRRTGSDGDLKTTINVDQGHPYNPKARTSGVTPEILMRRKKTYNMGEVPDMVRFLVATVDIQADRFDVLVTGYDEFGTAYVIDRYRIRISNRPDDEFEGQFKHVEPANYPEDWDLLIDQVIEKKYPLADGSERVMGIHQCGSDSGGKEGFTVNAYAFWLRLKNDPEERGYHNKFLLLKGASSQDAPQFRVTYPNSDRKDRKAKARGEIPVGMIGTRDQKDAVMGMISKEEGDGRVVFPDGFPKWAYRELFAEIRTPIKWENPKRARNETFDCLVYSVSLLRHRSIRYFKIDWDKAPAWADEWDRNELVFELNSDGVYAAVEEEATPKPRLRKLGAALA